MVRVKVEKRRGMVVALDMEGHTKTGPCAALSSLVRTYAKIVDRHDGVDMIGSAPAPGEFHLTVMQGNSSEFLRGASAFLLEGMKDVASGARRIQQAARSPGQLVDPKRLFDDLTDEQRSTPASGQDSTSHTD